MEYLQELRTLVTKPIGLFGGLALILLLVFAVPVDKPTPASPLPASLSAKARSGPKRLAVVIDDIGYSWERALPILSLPPGLTLAILPTAPHAYKLALKAHQTGHQVVVHLPLEPTRREEAENGALLLSMSGSKRARLLEAHLRQIPYAVGVNNHQGSRFTAGGRPLLELLGQLQAKQLFFLDSRTTAATQVPQMATKLTMRWGSRDLFLDHERNVASIRQQFSKAVRLALTRGQAVAIGHPYPETTRVLQEELPRLRELHPDLELAPLSRLMK